MDTSAPFGPRFFRRRNRQAFSLIEVALAIGVMSFGLLATFGLVPVGMSTFHQAIDTSISSEIVQHVVNDARQSDFSSLLTSGTGNQPITVSTGPGLKPVRYFDYQGDELGSATNAIYQVNTRVTAQTSLPVTSGSSPITTLATVTVQIAANPGNRTVQTNQTTQLWSDPTLNISTYSAMVAKNK